MISQTLICQGLLTQNLLAQGLGSGILFVSIDLPAGAWQRIIVTLNQT